MSKELKSLDKYSGKLKPVSKGTYTPLNIKSIKIDYSDNLPEILKEYAEEIKK